MSAFHAALAGTFLALGVGMAAVGRSWPARRTPGRHRRPTAQHAPAYGAAVPTGLGVCPPCGGLTTVTVHGQVHRCDRGHHTTYSLTGDL